jgi:hypothetical protein
MLQVLIVDFDPGDHAIFAFGRVLNAHRGADFDPRSDVSVSEGFAALRYVGDLLSIAVFDRTAGLLHHESGRGRVLGDRAGAGGRGGRGGRRDRIRAESRTAQDAARERNCD